MLLLSSVEEVLENIGALKMTIFALRTIVLFGGIFFLWWGIRLLWELRPVRKKKYTTVVHATVDEAVEENRSASMNSYYKLRFVYELDGEERVFAPIYSVRNARVKAEERVKLCISGKNKFRTIREKTTLKKALLLCLVGVALILSQIIV
ncbi:MAG: hypothetical protein LUE12_01515 [Ruminococcus sp.]|nr:hypothetical protein [Ruminococcus sp.]